MKKLFFILVLLASFYVACAQSKSFLGLTLGKTYTEEDVRSVIGRSTNGAYEVTYWSDRTSSIQEIKEEVNTRSASFAADVILSPITVSVAPVQSGKGRPTYMFSLSSKNELRSVLLAYDESCGLPSLVYWHLADSLSAFYHMEPIENGIGLQCYDAEGMTISLRKEDAYVLLSYSDNSYIEKAINQLLPIMQDTFLGLKIGNKYTIERIKSTIGSKGRFVDSERTASGMRITFADVAYAGKLWDYGDFMITHDGEFSKFSVYDSLMDYSDERKEAKGIYEQYKESLDKKYSNSVYPSIEDDGINISAMYKGSNGIGLILYNKRDKTTGGSYRRFVGMDYMHIGISTRLQESIESEL